MSDQPSGTISIAATFTIEPLLPCLSFVLEQCGVCLDVHLSPYNQLFQELLSPASFPINNTAGINVLLIRLEDFVRDASHDEEACNTITRTAGELATALMSFASRAQVPTIVSIFAPSPRAGRLQSVVDTANVQLTSRIGSCPGILLLTNQEINRISDANQFDIVSDELAHVPFTEQHYAAIALAIARKTHAALVPPHKVLVLDCDNTLWHGVVGEDGVDGIKITPAFASLQRFSITAYSQGTLICLISKNNERDVLDVFEQRPDMLLKLDHVVAHRINWEAKPKNLASIAMELNLGLESFVFMDDNPVECALMQAELPQVVTLQVPSESEIDSFLANVWAFDKIAVTDEDLRRTQMYKEDAKRHAVEVKATDIGEFIASLNVRVDIHPPSDGEWPRLSQLTQRTNQFNFTTKRRTETELRATAATGMTVLRINVEDRFGDYGLVGLVVASIQTNRLYIDTFLLSCRVLGRGVEHAILRELGRMADTMDLSTVAIPLVTTSKNEPARAFIESVASQFRTTGADCSLYLVPAAIAGSVAHRPGFDPDAVIEASRPKERYESSTPASAARSGRYTQLARQLTSGREVNTAIKLERSHPRTLANDASPPSNETQRQMAAIWEDTLATTGLGIDDDYFSLGGSSLAAATLFAEVARQFGVKLPLTTILSFPTIRTLTEKLSASVAQTNSLVELKGGSQRNLFLIHDGDGETLLYANIARRLPDGVAVYGVNPRTVNNVPLAHARIEDMASFYIDQIKQKQPHGPYTLGGMCAGGVIAYEMANQLIEQGDSVELVMLLDAATPQAQYRPNLVASHRLGRLSRMIKDENNAKLPIPQRAVRLLFAISRKIWNLLSWEVTSRITKWSVRVRFHLLRTLLSRAQSWPRGIPGLTVRQIYEGAEAVYVPPSIASNVVLLRASTGRFGDTPYVELYSDDTLGWAAIVPNLRIADVDGGHFSMLQEPFAAHLAATLQDLLSSPSASRLTRSPIDELAQ